MVARLLKGLKMQSKTPLADFLATQLCLAKQRQIVKTAQNRNLGRLAGTAVEIKKKDMNEMMNKVKVTLPFNVTPCISINGSCTIRVAFPSSMTYSHTNFINF